MRMALTSVVVASCLSAAPASAEPATTCPPDCDRIPEAAWIAPAAIPLNAVYSWPRLAGLAVTSRPPRFRCEHLCATPAAAGDPRSYAVAERAQVSSPRQCSTWACSCHSPRGETWRGGQLVRDAFAAAVAALRACQATNPAASPSLTLDQPERLAGAVSGPVVLHQYLLADPINSTMTELALWTDGPAQTPWPAVSESAVLDALGAPLCTAYVDSCP
ncbi:MAG: ATPase [Mycobacterium sp.]